MNILQKIFSSFWNFLKGLGTRRVWVAVVIGIVIIGGVLFSFLKPEATTEDEIVVQDRPVELIPVSEFGESSGTQTVRDAGSDTALRSETSGKIVSVLPVGSRVARGNVVAQFENSAQRASLLQAEGALEVAEASLEKTQGGPRSERLAVLEATFESAESSAVTTLLSAYATVDSAVRSQSDQVFSNPESNTPEVTYSSSNTQRLIDVQNQRVLLNDVLARQASIASTLSVNSVDLQAELSQTEDEVRQVRTFVDTLITSLNEAIPAGNVNTTVIAAYKTDATAARTALTSSLSAIISTRASLETARQNLDEGVTGAEAADLSAAEASVKQAQGAYNAALSAFEKNNCS